MLLRCVFKIATTIGLFLVALVASSETITARVGVIPVIGASPLFVAEKEGWLKEGGLKLETKVFESGPNIIQAVASGGIDIYVAGVAPVAAGRAKGVDLRVVSALAVNENVLVASGNLKSFFKAGITARAALKAFHESNGKPAKLATQPPGSVPAANLQYWLRVVNQVDPSDFEIVNLGIDAAQQALLAGAVDGATVREPTLTIINQAKPEISVIASGKELFPGQPGTVVAVSKGFLEKNPREVQLLVASLAKAVDELEKNPDRAAPFVEEALSKGLVSREIIRKSLSSKAVEFVLDPRAIIESTKALLDYQVTLGVIEKAPDIGGLFDSTYFQNIRVDTARGPH